jgi:hypothetical protein
MATCEHWSAAMDSAVTSFLVCQFYLGMGDSVHLRWSRLEAADTDRLDRLFTMHTETGLVPLASDDDCFQHVPGDKHYQNYRAAWDAEREIDGKLYPYLDLPQLRVLPAGGAVKGGKVVVHYFGARDERVAKIHRFEAPGATVPFAGREFPIFHVLSPDLVGKIARHYVTTCTVPDGSIVGSGLAWVPWRDGTIGWGGF